MIEVMNDTSLIHEKCIYTSYINGISMARKLNQRHNLLFNLYSELRYSEQEKVFDSFKNSLYTLYYTCNLKVTSIYTSYFGPRHASP